jgi:ribosome maturation factor RimP
MTALQADIEDRLAQTEPDVEVLVAELVGGSTLRVFIDHPDGVTLDLCERVTGHLAPLREQYRLEVSSPGIERPLSKPAHYRRFLGRRARIRTRPHRDAADHAAERSHSVTGELVGATDDEVTLAAPDGLIAIPYSEISRSNLVEE